MFVSDPVKRDADTDLDRMFLYTATDRTFYYDSNTLCVISTARLPSRTPW